MYYILVCLSKVFQRTIFLSSSRFQRESVCKGKAFFHNLQIFSKVFWKNFSEGLPEGVRLTLSRSLAHLQGKILGAASGTLFPSPSSSSLSYSAALPLESGCKGTDFFHSRNFYHTLFWKVFSGFWLTRWFSLCYKAYFLLMRENVHKMHYII